MLVLCTLLFFALCFVQLYLMSRFFFPLFLNLPPGLGRPVVWFVVIFLIFVWLPLSFFLLAVLHHCLRVDMGSTWLHRWWSVASSACFNLPATLKQVEFNPIEQHLFTKWSTKCVTSASHLRLFPHIASCESERRVVGEALGADWQPHFNQSVGQRASLAPHGAHRVNVA